MIGFEELLVSPEGFGLVGASGLQRAIARTVDGRPIGDALGDDDVERYFGCARSRLGLVAPVLVVLVAGVRSGKSLMAACAAVKCVLTANLSQLLVHEVARFAIIAPTVDNATATLRLLVGSLQASPVLARFIVGEPTADTVTIRRADGRVVEIVVVAAHRGAVTLRSRWLVGFIIEEAALFGTDATGAVVNAEELLRAGETRLVRGGQGLVISSPFGPSGLLYSLWRTHFGNPGRVLVCHAPTIAMNAAIDREAIEAIRARDPDAAAREYDALWVDAHTALLDGAAVDTAVRSDPIEAPPPPPGGSLIAAWDAATRGNAWTLVVAQTNRNPASVRVLVARQWIGSRVTPLMPTEVLKDAAALLLRYGLRAVHTDQHGGDFVRALASQVGLTVIEHATPGEWKDRAYSTLRTLFATGAIELPPVPALVADLKLIRRTATANGIRVDLPKTPDGRHCDFAPSLALAVSYSGVAGAAASGVSMFSNRHVGLSARGSVLTGLTRAQQAEEDGPALTDFKRGRAARL